MIQEYTNHSRNHSYMSGVERNQLRIKQTAEIFTPTWQVQDVLDKIELFNDNIFTDEMKTFIDTSCGD